VDRNNIYVFSVNEDEDFSDIVFPKPYKKATTYGAGYGYSRIIMHNF
jgi:hypothetical protein